jgi:hypothetical protein
MIYKLEAQIQRVSYDMDARLSDCGMSYFFSNNYKTKHRASIHKKDMISKNLIVYFILVACFHT